MQNYARVSLVCWFLLLPVLSFAADEPAAPAKAAPAAAVKPGPKNAEFARLLGQWKTLMGDLATLKVQYPSADAKRQAEIKTTWKQLIAKGDALEPQLLAAAEQAYVETPNVNREVTGLLVAVLAERIGRDEYEPALVLGKLLVDNKCPRPADYVPGRHGRLCPGRPRRGRELSTEAAKTNTLTDQSGLT